MIQTHFIKSEKEVSDKVYKKKKPGQCVLQCRENNVKALLKVNEIVLQKLYYRAKDKLIYLFGGGGG